MSYSNLAKLLFLCAICSNSIAAPILVLDDFNSGDISVVSTINSTFGDPVPGVFGDNRAILLLKEDELSATSMSVGSGVLTWNETGDDYASIVYGTVSTSLDLSIYNAFRITVNSAPLNAGSMDFVLWYRGSATHNYGVRATAALPTLGTIDIPFSTLRSDISFPPIDLTQVSAIVMEFPGDTGVLAHGTYVFDDFQAVQLSTPPVTISEPPSSIFLLIGSLGLFALRYGARTTE